MSELCRWQFVGQGRCRTFKNKAFVRFAKKAEIGDAVLCEAIRAAERGLIAADLEVA